MIYIFRGANAGDFPTHLSSYSDDAVVSSAWAHFDVYLREGEYRLMLRMDKHNNRGIVAMSIDGTGEIDESNEDTYGATRDRYHGFDRQITINDAGIHRITFNKNGKNAASSGGLLQVWSIIISEW